MYKNRNLPRFNLIHVVSVSLHVMFNDFIYVAYRFVFRADVLSVVVRK